MATPLRMQVLASFTFFPSFSDQSTREPMVSVSKEKGRNTRKLDFETDFTPTFSSFCVLV